jgi:hypothetical protein
VNEDPVAPSLINPAIPGGIDAVIRKALAKDPKDRFQTCEEMRKAFMEQSVRLPLTPPATVRAEKVVANQSPIPASARPASQLAATPSRIWSRLILVSALVIIAATGWAFYIRSQSRAFPPFIAKIESKIRPALSAVTGKFGESSTQVPGRAADEHSIAPAHPQNPETPDATPAAVSQTSATPEAPSPVAVPTLQPVAQSSSDHPISEGVPVSGAPPSSPPVETPQKLADRSQNAPPQAAESSDKNQPATDKATTRDPITAPSASHDDDEQPASAATTKPPARKHAPESTLAVDGFSRRDILDLLSQADSSTARGDYRLARYEYGLVLKLDRNNVQAREGLRRLAAAWRSR